jgi:hypothetical protein
VADGSGDDEHPPTASIASTARLENVRIAILFGFEFRFIIMVSSEIYCG